MMTTRRGGLLLAACTVLAACVERVDDVAQPAPGPAAIERIRVDRYAGATLGPDPWIAFHSGDVVTRESKRADGAWGPSHAHAPDGVWAHLVERVSALSLGDAPYDHTSVSPWSFEQTDVDLVPMLYVARSDGTETSAAWVDAPSEVDAFFTYVEWLDEQLAWQAGEPPPATHDDTVTSFRLVFDDRDGGSRVRYEWIEVRRDGSAWRALYPRANEGVEGGVFRAETDPALTARFCDDVGDVAKLAQDGRFGGSHSWGFRSAIVGRADGRRHEIVFSSTPPDDIEPFVWRMWAFRDDLTWDRVRD